MNSTFSFSRFGNLFEKHTGENFKNYLISVLVLCGLITVFYSLLSWDRGYLKLDQRFGTMLIIYLFSSCIFTSSIFAPYNQKSQATLSLTLPASHFEKFLIGWAYSFLIFTFVYALCFYAVDFTFGQFGKTLEHERNLFNILAAKRFRYSAFYSCAFLHSVLFFGAIYFRNMHFVKTVCVFFVVVFLLLFAHYNLLKFLIMDEILFSMPFLEGVTFKGDSYPFGRFRFQLGVDERNLYYFILTLSVTLILWTAAFFRLKEKQI